MPLLDSRVPRPAEVVGRTLSGLAGLLRDALVAPVAGLMPRDWLVLRLDRGLSETGRSRSLGLENLMPSPRPLSGVLEALELAREDPRLRGVVIKLGSAPLGWAKVNALARALALLRASGKKLIAYAESAGNAGAWLGGLADAFWMAPEGRLDLLGIRTQNVFLRRALDRLNIRPEVLAAGRYKSAAEIIDRDSLSEPAREALESVVEELYQALLAGLVAGRASDPEQAARWIDAGPYLASEALEAGIVDELVYSDQLPQKLAQLEQPPRADRDGEPAEARLIAETSYLRLARPRFDWRALLYGPAEIAVVPLVGLIRRSSARPIVALLRRLGRSDRVRAVVLRIDSPGGDSLASDLIWRAVSRLAEQKPVIASLGDAAASGGYYAAMGAREIIAEATTLTGSIGVVMIGFGFEGILTDLGVSTDGVQRGRHADIYDPLSRRSEENRALLRRQVTRLYADFVAKTARSRGLSEAEVDRVAQGRVWTGAQAHARGLVDAVGGLDLALERARALAGLGSDEGRPVYYSLGTGPLAAVLRQGPLETLLLSPGVQSLCPTLIPLD